VKAVQELIYPSEIGGAEGSSFVGPQNMTMREIGMILQVIPDVGENALITLSLRPQWVSLDGWVSYPTGSISNWNRRTIPFRQPVCSVMSFDTQVSVTDGDTILLGNASTPDGEWVNVGFLTAKRMRIQ
jgi:type II secretory pathway component GspD/PulD (secretin)